MSLQAAKAIRARHRPRAASSIVCVLLAAGACIGLLPIPVFGTSQPAGGPARVAVRWAEGSWSGPITGAAKVAEATDRLRPLVETGAVGGVSPLIRADESRPKVGSPDLSSVILVDLTGAVPTAEVVSMLGARDDVVYAVALRSHELFAVPDDLQSTQTEVFAQINLPEAWDLVRGEQGSVVVGVVDGGFDLSHPELAANVWLNEDEIAGNGIDDDRNGFVDDVNGWSFSENSPELSGNPLTPENTRHGTHVAGIIGAVTDNGSGMAGAAWNVRIMPVRVAHPDLERRIDFGYEGIVYAVANGAEVVNLSWGGPALPTPFERDVVEWAWSKGAVLVAAVGNTEDTSVTLPGAYPHVLSVASLDPSGRVSNFSTRGWWVDLAAPGEQILGPTAGGGLELRSGTSFATPLVSSICALVRTRWPQSGPDAVAERVRMSGHSVEDVQLPWNLGVLGRGRVDALRALTQSTPAVRITSVDVQDEDGDGALEPGEIVGVSFDVINHLEPGGPFEVEMQSRSPHLTPLGGWKALNVLGSGDSATVAGLAFRVDEAAPLHERAVLQVDFRSADGQYVDTDGFDLLLSPAYVTHQSNPLRATVAIGRIAHSAEVPAIEGDGAGMRYRRTADLIADAGLMIGVSPTQVSDAARTSSSASSGGGDFQVVDGSYPRWISRGDRGHWNSLALFDDSGATEPLGIEIEQESMQVEGSSHEDALILRYTLTNSSGAPIPGLRVGYACDWSIDRSSPLTNRLEYESKRGIGYAWDESGNGGGVVVGLTVASTPGVTSFYGIDDSWSGQDGRWGLYDGFSEPEKWESLSSGVVNPGLGPADVTMVVGTGPFDLEAGSSVTVAFVFAAGDDRADLFQNVEHAQRAWKSTSRAGLPGSLSDTHPNPVGQGEATWTLSAPSAGGGLVEARIYDVRGRLVRRVFRGHVEPGAANLSWDRHDDSGRPVAAGLYFLRVKTQDRTQTRRVLVVR